MNPVCPTCEHDFREEMSETLTPYEETEDRVFTLQFCSPECRDEYKKQEESDP